MKILLEFSVLSLILLISLATFHELGHAFFATLNNCQAISVIFEGRINTYTIVKCEEGNSLLILFGGLIFTILLSFLLLFLGKHHFLLSLSFSLLLAAEDLSAFFNPILIYALSIILTSLAFKEFSKSQNKRI